ncbi:BadF/BadG/BcrA/BcrD ATPase family protein [Paraglaciecola polaris]|uniref:ATPase, BadF/BadG/BcrA/BcrD type n=1 Tax=Paraglaciecola polaris LMG 21857 TaxID=1129793 RepID=K7A2A0_9ALTE|nr:BadF/BadG/BcrA/BcrD ATPase family protein [Paraglaciecola polaris]GAC35063.1 ATPase, BadF/BadG/BcrA/BcrD type [Paraglaciecola polaris LMG 21857]
MHDDYYLGIDGGGTQCRAAIYSSDSILLGSGIGGPANPVNGLSLAQDAILQAATQALDDAKLKHVALSQLNVGAGIAGLHLPSMQLAMELWQHPFKSFYCTTDLHAAVTGMHQGKDGGVIILGTGFSALGMVNGVQHSIGGYGFPINAEGSGSWLGLQAVKAALLAYDDIGPATSMLKAMTQQEDILSLATRLNQGSSTEFATFAPLVFEHAAQGDLLAKAIVEQATEFLQRVIRKLNAMGVSDIVLVGSVAHRLQSRLKENFSHSIVAGKASAEFGAMLLAKTSLTGV